MTVSEKLRVQFLLVANVAKYGSNDSGEEKSICRSGDRRAE